LLQRALGEHIDIALVQSEAPLWVLVDPGQLENALLNLCLNSRDAMPAGGQLTLQTGSFSCDAAYKYQHPGLVEGNYVTVDVTDTGSGIAPENLSLVFEPFFTTKEQGKGTGLGLAMVYGFVKQSDGHVTVQSTPGVGTVVRMFLRPAHELPRRDAPVDTGLITPGGGDTILLVEDDAMVRTYAVDMLTRANYRVLTAGNGVEALQILQERRDIDLLFTDVVMPGGLNGCELTDLARKGRPGLRVLYTSGYSADALTRDGRLVPGVSLLKKPYRRHDLLQAIQSALHEPVSRL
jgi:CheY-like chemotaxis protein